MSIHLSGGRGTLRRVVLSCDVAGCPVQMEPPPIEAWRSDTDARSWAREHAPGWKDWPAALAASHHLLLSHGWAVPVAWDQSLDLIESSYDKAAKPGDGEAAPAAAVARAHADARGSPAVAGARAPWPAPAG